MATIATPQTSPTAPSDRDFFLRGAIAIAVTIVTGFSVQLAMGRSSFSSPLPVHLHAIFFMGWITIYLIQNVLAARGNLSLHRRLGWIAAVWMVPMLVLGIYVTVAMVRRGQVPFFFQPQQFLIFDPVALMTFVGLTTAAIVWRRQTDWHKRLHFCGTSMLLGPAFGRLLPLPLLAPWSYEATVAALMLFPIAGVIADKRRSGHVHPAWKWGIGTMIASLLVTNAVAYSPLGAAIYQRVAAGSAGANVAPLGFPPPPAGPRMTGRDGTGQDQAAPR